VEPAWIAATSGLAGVVIGKAWESWQRGREARVQFGRQQQTALHRDRLDAYALLLKLARPLIGSPEENAWDAFRGACAMVDLLGSESACKALDEFVSAKDVRPDGTVYVRPEAYDALAAELRADVLGASRSKTSAAPAR